MAISNETGIHQLEYFPEILMRVEARHRSIRLPVSHVAMYKICTDANLLGPVFSTISRGCHVRVIALRV